MEDQSKEFQDYVKSIQDQILEIINKVKEESGVDLPVDVRVRSSEDE